MEMTAESLVKTQELGDSNRGEQERNREARRIHRQQKNAAGNRLRVRSQHQHGGENRSDAGRPAKGKSKAEQKSAGYSGERAPRFYLFFRLTAEVVEADVSIEPARERRSGEKNERYREQLHGAKQAARA